MHSWGLRGALRAQMPGMAEGQPGRSFTGWRSESQRQQPQSQQMKPGKTAVSTSAAIVPSCLSWLLPGDSHLPGLQASVVMCPSSGAASGVMSLDER